MGRSRLLFVALAVTMMVIPAAPAGAQGRMQRLGEDPSGDGPPALDVTYLDVKKGGILTHDGAFPALEIRIGVAGMLPEIGGYPEAPGIEWVFDVGKRTFVAEAVGGRPVRFFLFELIDGKVHQLENPAGTYDADDGFIRMVVALKWIGAKRGTRISGADDTEGGGDVDAHIHYASGTYYADTMTTTKDFVVP